MFEQTKKGNNIRVFRGKLMNVSEQYDDDKQYKNTHTDLYPKEGGVAVYDTVFKQITLVLTNKKEKEYCSSQEYVERLTIWCSSEIKNR